MRRLIAIMIVLLNFFFYSSGAIAAENLLGLCYEGEIYRVSGFLDKGKALANLEELLKILQAEVMAKEKETVTLLLDGKKEVDLIYFLQDPDNIYVPLRQLGEKLYKKVYWEGKTNTVIWAEQDTAVLFTNDFEIMEAFLADDWMYAESKEALYSYFAPLLAGELLYQVTENTWEFVSQATDWHERYYLNNLQPLAAGPSWRALLAEIQSKGLDENSIGYGFFIFTRQPDGGWKITDMDYYWP